MTLRGYRKNLVVIKNLEDGIIDEAFFFLRDGTNADDDDIVREANRIISRSKELKAIKNAKHRFSLPEFLIGAIAMAVLALISVLIFI